MRNRVFLVTENKMRLLLSILLIPLVLASQTLCAMHAHHGQHSVDAESHAIIGDTASLLTAAAELSHFVVLVDVVLGRAF